MPTHVTVPVEPNDETVARIYVAGRDEPGTATLVLGHGAGAGQRSAFMVDFATGLANRSLDVVTFDFPYMTAGRRVPDRQPRLEACYRAVIAMVQAHAALAGRPLVIGGKSMGGRIASHVAAGRADVAGLVFLGYPLHPPKAPERLRVEHLAAVRAPMLFVQGTRDGFGTPTELRQTLLRLPGPIALHEVEGGDHSFKLPRSDRRTKAELYGSLQDVIAAWVRELMR